MKEMVMVNINLRKSNRCISRRKCNNRKYKRTTTTKLCNNIHIEKRNDKFKLGTRIIKRFNNVPYEGKVIGYRD